MPSQQSSSQSTVSPPEWVKDRQGFQLLEADRIYKGGAPQYFPYSTVASQNQYQTQAMDLASQGAAGNLDPVYSNIESKVLPSVQAAYSAAGRSPGGAGSYGATAAKALTEAYAPYALQQYNTDYNRLYQAGQDQNQYNQANVNDAVNRWQYNQNLPWDQLARYQSAINVGNPGQTTTSPYYSNPYLQGLGAFSSLLGAFRGM